MRGRATGISAFLILPNGLEGAVDFSAIASHAPASQAVPLAILKKEFEIDDESRVLLQQKLTAFLARGE
jgi:hypothetical protein